MVKPWIPMEDVVGEFFLQNKKEIHSRNSNSMGDWKIVPWSKHMCETIAIKPNFMMSKEISLNNNLFLIN